MGGPPNHPFYEGFSLIKQPAIGQDEMQLANKIWMHADIMGILKSWQLNQTSSQKCEVWVVQASCIPKNSSRLDTGYVMITYCFHGFPKVETPKLALNGYVCKYVHIYMYIYMQYVYVNVNVYVYVYPYVYVRVYVYVYAYVNVYVYVYVNVYVYFM